MRRAPTSTEEFERRPKTARNSEIDTKTKLLNAAERLFSDKGIEAVSHRDIALAAAVNLAALIITLVPGSIHTGRYRETSRTD